MDNKSNSVEIMYSCGHAGRMWLLGDAALDEIRIAYHKRYARCVECSIKMWGCKMVAGHEEAVVISYYDRLIDFVGYRSEPIYDVNGNFVDGFVTAYVPVDDEWEPIVRTGSAEGPTENFKEEQK